MSKGTSEANELLKRAITNKTPAALYLNKHGEQATVEIERDNSEEDAFRLSQGMDSPSFEVCMALDGRLTDRSGDAISINELPRAIKDAQAERIRFYTEREKEFGPSAWPGGRAS
jgi:hypothetical protein